MTTSTSLSSDKAFGRKDIRPFFVWVDGNVDVEASLDKFREHLEREVEAYQSVREHVQGVVVDLLNAASGPVDAGTLVSVAADKLSGGNISKTAEYKEDVAAFIKANASDLYDPESPTLLCQRKGRGGGVRLWTKVSEEDKKKLLLTPALKRKRAEEAAKAAEEAAKATADSDGDLL
ncbi:MAG: hypothetical protein LC122_02425 [Chitinophagales bacterium]|nr:hypothetical protein [Chitinophagales bacterium]